MSGATVGPLAGACAPPVRERAAVERPGGGALIPSARARALGPETASGGASCAAPRRSGLRGSVPHEGGRLWGGAGEYPPPFALGLGFAVRFDSKSIFFF